MLIGVFAAGAALCLAYFIVILIYSGMETVSAVMWLFFAGGFGVTAFSVWYYQKFPERMPLRLPVSLVTLCGAGAAVMLLLQILIISRVPQVADSGLEYLIVLGAHVGENGRPGRTLQLRLDKAAEYAMQNPETLLILSGGKTREETKPEAQVMMDYLMERGVPRERMALECQSTSTTENIAYSRLMIEEIKERKQEEIKDERVLPAYLPSTMNHGFSHTNQVGILTSNFHLYRATQIAKKQGMKEISGIASPSDRILFVHLCFRDGLAILKERLAGNL